MTFEKPFNRISVEPDMMGGEPCIGSMRITVRNVLSYLASYESRAELLEAFPELEERTCNNKLSRLPAEAV